MGKFIVYANYINLTYLLDIRYFIYHSKNVITIQNVNTGNDNLIRLYVYRLPYDNLYIH